MVASGNANVNITSPVTLLEMTYLLERGILFMRRGGSVPLLGSWSNCWWIGDPLPRRWSPNLWHRGARRGIRNLAYDPSPRHLWHLWHRG